MAVLIFKPTESCNSNCAYCEVVKTPKTAVMSLDLMELVFQRIDEYLIQCPDDDFVLTWHGGEACLLGVDFFRRAKEFQTRHCARTQDRIRHLIQSNLTLINQEYIDAFSALGIRNIGSSYDPIPHIRGFGKDRDSDAYNAGFFRGIDLLRRNGMSWGFIYVVHRRSLEHPLALFQHLVNLNLAAPPNFHRVQIFYEDKQDLAVSGSEFADFLGSFFETWWRNRGAVRRRPAVPMVHGCAHRRPGQLSLRFLRQLRAPVVFPRSRGRRLALRPGRRLPAVELWPDPGPVDPGHPPRRPAGRYGPPPVLPGPGRMPGLSVLGHLPRRLPRQRLAGPWHIRQPGAQLRGDESVYG